MIRPLLAVSFDTYLIPFARRPCRLEPSKGRRTRTSFPLPGKSLGLLRLLPLVLLEAGCFTPFGAWLADLFRFWHSLWLNALMWAGRMIQGYVETRIRTHRFCRTPKTLRALSTEHRKSSWSWKYSLSPVVWNDCKRSRMKGKGRLTLGSKCGF